MIWKKDISGILEWVFNKNGYWRYLTFYDFKLTKRIFTTLWKEVVGYKWKKIWGKI
jgi:hypothetical protein